MELRPQDLRIDTYRVANQSAWISQPDTCVRITHLPTGMYAESCDDRSQHRNKVAAMKALQAKVDWLYTESPHQPRRVGKPHVFKENGRWTFSRNWQNCNVPAARKAFRYCAERNGETHLIQPEIDLTRFEPHAVVIDAPMRIGVTMSPDAQGRWYPTDTVDPLLIELEELRNTTNKGPQ